VHDCARLHRSSLLIRKTQPTPQRAIPLCLSPPATTMSLLTLSTELFSKVCRFLGLHYNSLAEEWKCDNSSFESPRLTCRALYIAGLRSKLNKATVPNIGCHVASYRIQDTEIAAFFATHHAVEYMQLLRSLNEPLWQDCIACNDLLAEHIALNEYTFLSSLSISSNFVYGCQLQRFLMGYTGTLKTIHLSGVILVEGSWKSIAHSML
jgi:hypothetical protein